MEYPSSNVESKNFILHGSLQIATAADALSVLPGNHKKVSFLRAMSPLNTNGGVSSEGISAQRIRVSTVQSHEVGLKIIKGLELQLLDSNLPPQQRVAALALWEVMAESFQTTA